MVQQKTLFKDIFYLHAAMATILFSGLVTFVQFF